MIDLLRLSALRRVVSATAATAFLLALPSLASAQRPTRSLAEERAAATKAGLILSAEKLSRPMPPPDENAALLYERYSALANAQARLSEPPSPNAKPRANENAEVLFGRESGHPEELTDADWIRVRDELSRRADQLAVLRMAASRTKCVLTPHEYVLPLTVEGALSHHEFLMNAGMRNGVRLLVSEAIWESHEQRVSAAIHDLTLGFDIAHHANQHNTIIGQLTARAVGSITVAGFQKILHMSGNDASVCHGVESAIAANRRFLPLSEAVKIDAASEQGVIDYTAHSVSEKNDKREFPPSVDQRFIEEYGAFALREIRHCIAVVDEPYPQSAPVLQAIGKKAEAKYPEKGPLPAPLLDYSGAVFWRDSETNLANITRIAALVLAFRDEKGHYPASIAEAMPNAPTDAFDGKPFQYEVTPKGFVVKAVHQRPGHKPEIASFTYTR